MSGPGIDYGSGRTNINHETGIRYGVISQNSVLQAWADSAEPDYGPATCPKCGRDALTYDTFEGDDSEFEIGHGCADFVCVDCEYVFDSQEAFGDEAQSWSYVDDDYELGSAFDNTEIFVTKSPFYTFAAYCSPCAPGAGNLDSPIVDGAKTYCLGHDWFDDQKAPYPVYRVDDNSLVVADSDIADAEGRAADMS